MANLLFANGKHNYSTKQISSTADTLKATLLSMSTAAGKIALISSSTNATPIVVTTTASHGYSTGDIVVVGGHATNTCANGTWQVGTTTSTTFQLLTRWDGLNSTGNGAGGATGWCIDITTAATLADVSANSVGTDVTIAGVTDTGGIVNASPWTWTTGLTATQINAIAIYDSSASNDLIAFIDGRYQVYVVTQTAASSTFIPVAGMGQPRLSATLLGTSVVAFSDGTTATMTAQNAVGDTSITVSSTAAIVHRQAQADVFTSPVAFPFTPAANGQVQFTPDSGTFKLYSL